MSVIVPMFNVEEYLDECLGSLRRQSYEHLEILVIDDGSQDGSAAIAARHAADDARIKVLVQSNAGLGAARNTGLRNATGDYLCFVDSDDVIPPKSITQMVTSAEKSGSDMVVGILTRFNANREWHPEWADLHSRGQIGIRPTDLPDIVRNNYSCGKLYRASFWRGSGLWFREGVAYEDQPLITQLYVRASRIDVLPTVTYQWRQRADRTSISQQTHSLRDLRDRVQAWTISDRVLSSEAPEALYDAWLKTLYTTHFHWYLKSNSTADDEYWKEIQRAVAQLTEGIPAHAFEDVEPQHRVAIELTRHDLREKLHEFKRAGGYTLSNFPAELTVDGLRFALPSVDDPDVHIDPTACRLADNQVPLVHRLERASWTAGGSLRLEGWAYFRYVDLVRHDTQVVVVLQHERTGQRIEADASYNPDHGFFAPVEDKFADYDPGAFAAELPVADFVERCDPETGDEWALEIRAATGPLERSVWVSRVLPGGSARVLPPYSTAKGVIHRLDLRGQVPHFVLRFLKHAVVAEDLALQGRQLSGHLRSASGERIHSFHLERVGAGGSHRVTIDPPAHGRFSVSLPPQMCGCDGTAGASTDWTLRATLAAGEHVPVTTRDEQAGAVAAEHGDHVVSIYPSARGVVTLRVGPPRVEVDYARLVGEELALSGRVPGVATCTLALHLQSEKARSVAAVVQLTEGSFEALVPLRHRPWRFGELPLPSASYHLASVLEPYDGRKITGEAVVTNRLTQRLPQSAEGDRVAVVLTHGPRGTFRARLVPPVGWTARGTYRRRQLEEHHRTRATNEPLNGVLIETYFGEVAGCNGTAIQRELRRRNADIPVYWAVKDHSVVVPEGGIPVVRDSSEWFQRLRTAKYLIDNMYQPPYHRKPAGQVIVATFHGYPFKVMGHPHWENIQVAPDKIASMDARAREWDYLLSPARYATPLLKRDFAYDGPILEIGYPRNDIFRSGEANGIRTATRECLGIGADATVILYAPTFRDYMSHDDYRAPLPDFLDAEQLARTLGEDYVILMRGHAFNARTRHRTQAARNIVDVTDYPEPADLCLASDLAVMDYSSLRFDYGVTGKPMLFLVPDLHRYQNTRGWLLEYEPTAPGPLLNTTGEVASAIQDLDTVVATYSDAYRRFQETYLDLEDGRASARFVDAVFVPRGDAPPSTG